MTQPESFHDHEGFSLDAERDEPGIRPSTLAVPAALLFGVTALVAADVAFDLRAGSPVSHVLVEAAAMVLAVGIAVGLWLQFLALRRRAKALRARLGLARVELTKARDDLERFRAESEGAMRGLGEAIDRQFERWGLTFAEREVALLLLKGLPTKEIADVRATSERTVRQQALAVYRKAALAGRAELAAFFLEDLLLPRPADAGPDG